MQPNAQAPVPELIQQPQSTTPIPAQPTSANLEQRNFLAAFLMTAYIGFTGLHQLYLGRKSQGWIRFGLFVLSFPLCLVLIGFLTLLISYIWAIIDFFSVYFNRVDANGTTLHATERDKIAAKITFIAILAFVGLYIFGIIAATMIVGLNGIEQRVQMQSSGY